MGITVSNNSLKRWLLLIGIWIASLFLFITPTYAEEEEEPTPEDIDEDFEEGDIKQHDMFEFEAFIKHGDISFGTAPFDSNDEPGNDSSDDNGIVRTWDTVTYPLKITVNPKKADELRNIKLRISGTLENGADDKRINAKFAVGGKEDVDKQEVSFVQEYTIERTGNSIMIPITVEVQGAKHGVMLRPDIKVEVVSVDGERINGVVTHFDELPSAMVSAKVSIKPIIGRGLAGQGMQYFPYSGIIGDESRRENTHAFALSWGITSLPNKSNIRGATFPDPEGKINYEITLSGSVAWDNPARTESFVFTGEDDHDTPFMLLDQRPISRVTTSVGAKNTVLEGRSYSFSRSNRYSAPLSYMTSMSQSHHSVWDSGTWEVSEPQINRTTVKYQGYNTGYVIGSTFPRHRADGYTGSYLYGVNDRVFSSNAFMVLMPNEYRIGGPMNPDGKANNANYRAQVKMISYTDENGVTKDFDNQRTVATTFTERNNPAGSMSVQTTFHSEPGNKQLGTPYIGNSVVSKGDISILHGQDVNWVGYFIHNVPLAGGYQIAYRWNTDAFELTPAYADKAERNIYSVGYYNHMMRVVTNDRNTQKVYYGVAKFDDNEFKNFTSKGKDDYDWYETYDEARQHGEVGAMLTDVNTFSPPSHRSRRIPLRVKHENMGIGSMTKDGTAAIAVTNAYAYMTEDREREIDVSANRAYHNPAIWDETGTMVKKQSPSGSTINFDTVAVIPSESATNLKSNKTTYYNSETIKWTATNSMVVPDSGLPEGFDASVRVKHELPVGLDYVAGSGRVGNQEVEPEFITHSNGKVTLVWDLLVSNQNHSIPNIKFDTTINPMALGSGIQSSLEVKSVIESELDMRPENLRTSTTNVTIIKVGMVGIHESINKTHGDKNSDYTVTLRPYTTIEDEKDVTGLTHIPSNDDGIGSEFDGSVSLKDIDLQVSRTHNKDSVDIYLNKSFVYDDKPNRIDVTKNGWYKYTGNPNQLKDAKSIYFRVNGLMTNRDNIRINLTIQTTDNNFGNEYLNETVINSATDYNLSPISNRVRYEIRPDWELSLERMQIYTNKKDEGLPVRVRILQRVLGDADVVKNYEFDLSLYDTETNERVASKKIKQSDLTNETDLLIEPDKLTDISKGDSRNYEVRIENYDDDRVWAKEPKLDTDGYVASEKVFTNSDITDNKVTYQGVTMTERELGQSIVKHHEKFTVNNLDIYTTPQVTKAGYGYQFTGDIAYENSMFNAVDARYKYHFGESNGLKTSTDANYTTVNDLLDKTIEYYNEDGSTPVITPNTVLDSSVANKYTTKYEIDTIYIKRGSGETYTLSQLGEVPSELEYIDSSIIADSAYRYKNMLYVPVWSTTDVSHDIGFTSTDVVGSNHVGFDFDGEVQVEASMFNHIDSETGQKDEIMLHQKRNE